jgi:hypothetical protein
MPDIDLSEIHGFAINLAKDTGKTILKARHSKSSVSEGNSAPVISEKLNIHETKELLSTNTHISVGTVSFAFVQPHFINPIHSLCNEKHPLSTTSNLKNLTKNP